MRSRGSPSSRQPSAAPDLGQEDRNRSDAPQAASGIGEGISRAADGATAYAADMKDRLTDTVSGYAESVSNFTGDASRKVSETSRQLGRQAQATAENTMNRVLREQPLAVALVGLAAGAAVAAAFPATEIENRALGGARDTLTDAASKAGRTVMDAAGQAGERLKTAAEERGLTSQGLKDLAGEVTGTFTDAVSGKSADAKEATIVPAAGRSGIGSSSRPASEPGEASRQPGLARTSTDPATRGGR